jgi:hypothetical protein
MATIYFALITLSARYLCDGIRDTFIHCRCPVTWLRNDLDHWLHLQRSLSFSLARALNERLRNYMTIAYRVCYLLYVATASAASRWCTRLVINVQTPSSCKKQKTYNESQRNHRAAGACVLFRHLRHPGLEMGHAGMQPSLLQRHIWPWMHMRKRKPSTYCICMVPIHELLRMQGLHP